MLFFGFDVEQYIKYRDFYYDYFDFIPGPLVKDTDQINDKIINEDFQSEKIKPFIKYFFGYSLGHASTNVVDNVIKPDLLEKEEETETNVKLDPPKSRIELFERSIEDEEEKLEKKKILIYVELSGIVLFYYHSPYIL